ncbi:MAG TPA: hypothetical protein PLE50_09950, partial [Rhabdaerophilum sp.]|nr:hypothetical protein [Rhabdaerophilum sp.]
ADILSMVAWAFSLAAAGLFPALVFGVWSKRVNGTGAVVGMIVGFGVTATYLWCSRYAPEFGVKVLGMSSLVSPSGTPLIPDMAKALADPNAAKILANKVGWMNISNISAAIFGLPAGAIAMYVVSMLTPAPSREMQDFIDACRRPRGNTLMEEKTA